MLLRTHSAALRSASTRTAVSTLAISASVRMFHASTPEYSRTFRFPWFSAAKTAGPQELPSAAATTAPAAKASMLSRLIPQRLRSKSIEQLPSSQLNSSASGAAVGASAKPATKYAGRFRGWTKLMAWLRNKDDDSVGAIVYSDAGLSRYMARVHVTAATAFGGSLLASYALGWALPMTAIMTHYPMYMLGGCFAAAMVSLTWFEKAAKTVKISYEQGKAGTPEEGKMVPVFACENSASRQAAFVAFLGANALMISPIVDLANSINPLMVPAAAGLAALVMGGASAYSYRAKPEHLEGWRAPLFGGLVAVASLQLAGLGSLLLVGPNPFAALVHSYQPYVGIALFSALTAFDTYDAVEGYQAMAPDHMASAISLYLNALNLLLDFLQLILEFCSDTAEAVSSAFD